MAKKALLPHISELLIKKENSFVDTAVFEPASEEEKKLGSLFIILEIEGKQDETIKSLAQGFTDVIQNEYYSNCEKEVLEAFEISIHRANETLAQLASRGVTDWLGKLHSIVAVLKNNQLHLVSTGKAEAYLVRGEQIVDISEGLVSSDKSPHPLKTFENISSGKIKASDKIILGTPELFNLISREYLRRTFLKFNTDQGTSHLEEILSSEETLGLGALIIGVKEKLEEEATFSPAGVPKEEMPTSEPVKKAPWQRIEKSQVQETRTERIRYQRQMQTAQGKLVWIAKNITLALTLTYKFVREKIIPVIVVICKWIFENSKKLIKYLIIQIKKIRQRYTQKEEMPLKPKFMPSKKLSISQFSSKEIFGPLKNSLATAFSLPRLTKARKLYLLVFIIIIILLGTSIGGITWRHKVNSEQIRLNEILKEAEDKKNQAIAALIYDDADRAEELLTQARELTGQVLGSNYFREQAQTLDNQIQEQFEQAGGIITVTPKELTNLANLGSNIQTNQLFIIGNKLYTFNSSSNSIYSYDLKNKKTHVEISGSSGIGHFEFGTSITEAGLDSIMFYTDTPGIVQFDTKNNKLYPLSIDFSDEEKNLLDIASYGSKIYLLSPNQGKLFKHYKTISGYSRPYSWVKSSKVDLTKSISLAIDGHIYLLNSDASILKLLNGLPTNFKIEDVSPELTTPTKIFTGIYVASLYILDPQNKRVVVFTKDGKYLAQYTSDKFDDLKGVWVDEKMKKIYLLSGAVIYEVELRH